MDQIKTSCQRLVAAISTGTAYVHWDLPATASHWWYAASYFLQLLKHDSAQQTPLFFSSLPFAFLSTYARTERTLLHVCLHVYLPSVLSWLVYNKVCSLSRPACPLLRNWLWWPTCHKRTSAEIPVIGALWSWCYSKMASSKALPICASFQASLCQLYSPLLHVPQYAHHYLYQMLLLHVVCTQSCRW